MQVLSQTDGQQDQLHRPRLGRPPLRNVTSLPINVWAHVASAIRYSGLGSSIVGMFPATVTSTVFISMSS